ncbi:hypothetical protein D9M70_585510 [compost metagenome]
MSLKGVGFTFEVLSPARVVLGCPLPELVARPNVLAKSFRSEWEAVQPSSNSVEVEWLSPGSQEGGQRLQLAQLDINRLGGESLLRTKRFEGIKVSRSDRGLGLVRAGVFDDCG